MANNYKANQKRISTQKQAFLDQLKTIPIIQVVCERMNLGRATFYRWKEEDPEFSNQVEQAISEGDYLVNDLAESQLLTAVKNGNMPAIALWLKTHHKKYGNRLEVTGKFEVDDGKLTEEQEKIVRRVFELSLLNPNTENLCKTN